MFSSIWLMVREDLCHKDCISTQYGWNMEDHIFVEKVVHRGMFS